MNIFSLSEERPVPSFEALLQRLFRRSENWWRRSDVRTTRPEMRWVLHRTWAGRFRLNILHKFQVFHIFFQIYRLPFNYLLSKFLGMLLSERWKVQAANSPNAQAHLRGDQQEEWDFSLFHAFTFLFQRNAFTRQQTSLKSIWNCVRRTEGSSRLRYQ